MTMFMDQMIDAMTVIKGINKEDIIKLNEEYIKHLDLDLIYMLELRLREIHVAVKLQQSYLRNQVELYEKLT